MGSWPSEPTKISLCLDEEKWLAPVTNIWDETLDLTLRELFLPAHFLHRAVLQEQWQWWNLPSPSETLSGYHGNYCIRGLKSELAGVFWVIQMSDMVPDIPGSQMLENIIQIMDKSLKMDSIKWTRVTLAI